MSSRKKLPPLQQFGAARSNESGLRIRSMCPLCAPKLRPLNAREVAAERGIRLIHFNCGFCGGNIIAFLPAELREASSAGLLTDLSYKDARRFRQTPAVSLKEVLASRVWARDGRKISRDLRLPAGRQAK